MMRKCRLNLKLLAEITTRDQLLLVKRKTKPLCCPEEALKISIKTKEKRGELQLCSRNQSRLKILLNATIVKMMSTQIKGVNASVHKK